MASAKDLSGSMSETYRNPPEGQYARRGMNTGKSEKLGGKTACVGPSGLV